MRFLAEIVRVWLSHLANVRNLMRTDNKTRWAAENVESLVIAVITVAAVVLLVVAYGKPWGWFTESGTNLPPRWQLHR